MTDAETKVQFALMLVGLGIRTVSQVISYFKADGADDETLATIQRECDARLQQWQTLNLPPSA